MKLIFIYNAKEGTVNRLVDFTHKLVSPSTYQCDLCQLTHGNFGERSALKKFRENTTTELTFYHIDTFEKVYRQRFIYPVVVKEENGSLEIFISNKELSMMDNIEELISLLRDKGID